VLERKGKGAFERSIKRLKSEPAEIEPDCGEYNYMEDQKEELFCLEEELSRARLKVKEFEKESIKNRKRFEQLSDLEKEKKRLEKVVIEVNKSKDA
jgi:hypothetical protein